MYFLKKSMRKSILKLCDKRTLRNEVRDFNEVSN